MNRERRLVREHVIFAQACSTQSTIRMQVNWRMSVQRGALEKLPAPLGSASMSCGQAAMAVTYVEGNNEGRP